MSNHTRQLRSSPPQRVHNQSQGPNRLQHIHRCDRAMKSHHPKGMRGCLEELFQAKSASCQDLMHHLHCSMTQSTKQYWYVLSLSMSAPNSRCQYHYLQCTIRTTSLGHQWGSPTKCHHHPQHKASSAGSREHRRYHPNQHWHRCHQEQLSSSRERWSRKGLYGHYRYYPE